MTYKNKPKKGHTGFRVGFILIAIMISCLVKAEVYDEFPSPQNCSRCVYLKFSIIDAEGPYFVGQPFSYAIGIRNVGKPSNLNFLYTCTMRAACV